MKKYLVSLVMMVILVGFTSCENQEVTPDSQVEVVDTFFPALNPTTTEYQTEWDGINPRYFSGQLVVSNGGGIVVYYNEFPRQNPSENAILAYTLAFNIYRVVRIDGETFIQSDDWEITDNITGELTEGDGTILLGIEKLSGTTYNVDVNPQDRTFVENPETDSFLVERIAES